MIESTEGENNSSIICRTCLMETTNLIGINEPITIEADNDFVNVTYMDCLMYCLGVKIDTSMPAYICVECISALRVAYAFLRNAYDAQEIFKSQQLPAQDEWIQSGDDAISRLQREVMPEESLLTCSYHCDICDEEFINEIYFTDHMKLHSEVVSYSCNSCPYQDSDLSNLHEHYATVHDIKAYRNDLDCSANSYASISDDLQPPPAPCANTSDDIQMIEVEPGCSAGTSAAPLIRPADINYQTILKEAGGVERLISESGKRSESFLQEVAVPFEKVCSFNPDKPNTQSTEANSELTNEPIEDMNTPVAPAEQVIVLYPDNSHQTVNTQATTFTEQEQTSIAEEVAFQQLTELNENELIIDESDDNPTMQTGAVASGLTINGIPVAIQIAPPSPDSKLPVKIYCNACQLSFSSNADLQNHMLIHQDGLQFLCDQCPYISISIIDLNQHYKSKHNSSLANKKLKLISQQQQLQHTEQLPKEQPLQQQLWSMQQQQELENVNLQQQHQQQQQQQQRTLLKVQMTQKRRNQDEETQQNFSCDTCVFECNNKLELKHHYIFTHCINPTEVQLRPNIVDSKIANIQKTLLNEQMSQITITKTYNLMALCCQKCLKILPTPSQLYRHFASCNADEDAQKNQSPSTSKQSFYNIGTATIYNSDTAALTSCHIIKPIASTTITSQTSNNTNQQIRNVLPRVTSTVTATTMATTSARQQPLLIKPLRVVRTSTAVPSSNVTAITTIVTTTSGGSALPAAGDAHSIDLQDLVESVFNDDDDKPCTSSAMKNVNTLAGAVNEVNVFADLDLSSDEFASDDNRDKYNDDQPGTSKTSPNSSKPKLRFCVHCRKFFRTQYKFENHMFIHRGVMPFRCTICTNTFNTKKSLIRHYRGEHDRTPSRDMIQAKGNKIIPDSSDPEVMQKQIRILQNSNYIDTLFKARNGIMCANCSFETDYHNIIVSHLKNQHGVTDEMHILYKLPLECTCCIRTYSSKTQLIRHLTFNHSKLSICKVQPLRGKLSEQQNKRKQTQQQRQQQQQSNPRSTRASTSTTHTPRRNRRRTTNKLNSTI